MSGTRPSEGIRRTLCALPRLCNRLAVHLSCLPPNISRELRDSPRRRLGHENRIMPFRRPQNNHATCDYIVGRNSCSRDMTNAGMFLMDSNSPCLFSLASASIMSIKPNKAPPRGPAPTGFFTNITENTFLRNAMATTALQSRAMPLRSAPKAQLLAATVELRLAAAKKEKAWSR